MVYDSSLVSYISFILVILAPISVFVVFFYAEPGFPWHTYITSILGFYAAFGIMLMIPIDVAVVISDRTSTTTGNDSDYDFDVNTLSNVYNTFFTIVLVLGSAVLIFEEYYNTDGYFTIGGKMWSSFKRMCKDLFIPSVVGLIILGILLGQKVVASNADALKLSAIIVTNTVYELFLMFLLGYSLVEYPRSIWAQSNLDGYLLKVQTKAAQQFKDISEAQLSVSLAVSDVLKTKSALASYGDHVLNAAMEVLTADCPPEFRSDRQGKVIADKKGKITIDTLAQLRTRLNVLKDDYKMAQAKVEGTKLLSYTLEDLVAAKNNPAGQVIHWSLTDKDSTANEFIWHIRIKPILLKIASLICAGLSFLSFLGVICSMQGVSNSVSPYYNAVHTDGAHAASVCIFIFLTFGYTVYITTWAIFEIKLGASYELVPGRTTPEALSFNVRMVARLAAPLAFFYLGWISENGIRTGDWTSNDGPVATTLQNVTVSINSTYSITELQNVTTTGIFMPSAFSKFYQLQDVSAVQEVFGTIFPIILYIVLGLCVLNVFNRILVFLKLDNYQFGAQIITEEQLREGKRQLQRHKPNTIRRYRRGELKTLISTLTGKKAENEEKGGGWLASILSVFSSKKVSSNRDTALIRNEVGSDSQQSIREPAGMLERKGGFSLGGGNWKEIYAEVRPPGYLHFYKDKKTAESNRSIDPSRSTDPQIIVIDLRSIIDFKIPEKKAKDNTELDLATADENIKLRFKSSQDVEVWRKGLSEWKDFTLDYGTIYQNTTRDPEIGRQSNSATSTNPLISSQSRATNELDSIHIVDEEEDDGKDAGKKNNKALAPPPASKVSLSLSDEKPAPLEGWLEKKGHGKMMSGDWQKRFLRIDEASSSLVYGKSSDPNEKPSGSIDLKFVTDITPYDKNGKPDSSRFNIDVADKIYKFKAANEAEGKRWIEGLNAWRDHFLLNMK